MPLQLNKDDINLVLAYSRGEARCLKRHREVKGSSLLLWFAYVEQSCLVSLRGAASRRLLLGCGRQLRITGERVTRGDDGRRPV